MLIPCPTCGTLHELPTWLQVAADDVAARQVIERALRCPSRLGGGLAGYLTMWASPGRRLRVTRARSVLGEILDMVEAGQVKRRGRVWPAPIESWATALEEMAEQHQAGKLTLPLRSHGYLLEIMVGLAERSEAAQERTREAERRHDVLRRVPAPEPEHLVRSIPEHVREHLAKYTRGRPGRAEPEDSEDANQA